MTAVGESDSSLAIKCLDLCQALTGQGLAFNFSLTIGSSFSFSLDARGKGLASDTPGKTKKKSSPSTIRRNARRKEAFLKKKRTPEPVSLERDVDPEVELPQQGEDAFKCDLCGNVFKSDNGLRIHKGKSHKSSELPHLEKVRVPDIVTSKDVSPLKDVREEVPSLQVYDCGACEEKFNTEDNLNIHMETHEEWRMEKCHFCKQLFWDQYEANACPPCDATWLQQSQASFS